MIAGCEKPWQVRAQLAAFEHERRGAVDARHRAAIDAQEAIFRAELERMETASVPEEPEPRNPARGTISWVGYRSVPPSVAG
jgi:hypothetical protein